jgi:catechol 2,3-dioxygenase-like lactoylglutathione lyase family enzyme
VTVTLDHVILPTSDQRASAELLSKMLGLPDGVAVGHFICIQLGNGVTVDVMASDEHHSHHLAFLVDDETFDCGVSILRSEHVPHWADPGHEQPGDINHRYGGRGVYFTDPGGNNLELLTRSMPLPTRPPPAA